MKLRGEGNIFMNNIIVMFPGQGSQHVGMGKDWYDKYESVKALFEKASNVIGYQLEELCFNGPLNELTQTDVAQVAVLTTSYAMFQVMQEEKQLPISYVTGHSLGEITALAAGGAISFEDAVKLVKVRGEAMAACTREEKTGMAAVVNVLAEQVEDIVKEYNQNQHNIQIANYNSDSQTVLAGKVDEISEICSVIEEKGIRAVRMNVSGAFHSSYMQNAVAPYVAALESMEINLPKIPVISSVTGKVYSSVEEIKNTLSKQLTNPVVWKDIVSEFSNREVRLWVEVGPKKVLKKLVASMVHNADVITLEEDYKNNYAVIDTVLKRKSKDPNIIGLCMGTVVATKNSNWDEQEYATGVIQNYKRLEDLQAKVEQNEVTVDDVAEEAINILRTILTTKKVSIEEQEARINSILEKTNSTVRK